MSVIQVRIKDDTLKQVDQLRERVHALSRSDAIRRAVELSDLITSAALQGDKILIEDKDGKKMRIFVTGLSEPT